MLSLSELQSKFRFIIDIEYIDFRSTNSFYYSKFILVFKDQSKLFITEFVSLNERSYSYHLQDQQNELIQRWDNSPHHREIETFPHHTHLDNKILASKEIILEDVLIQISTRFE